MQRSRSLSTLLILGSLASCVVDDPATESELEAEVSGGTIDADARYPWVVNVSSRLTCHGTLIAPRWVLTAAHCVQYSGATIRYWRTDPATGVQATGQRSVPPAGVVIHPEYDPYSLANDIALLQMDGELPAHPYVQLAELPNVAGTEGYVGTVASRTGSGLGPHQVAVYRAPILLHGGTTFITKTPTASLCPTDSGSGFVMFQGGKEIVFGIASAGSNTQTCAPGNEVAFTRVHHHLSWIREKTGVIPPTYDNHADILFRSAAGTPAIWFMDGAQRIGNNEPTWYGQPGVSNEWTIAAVGDLSSDSRSDILWRHTDGRLSAWFLVDGMLTRSSAPSWYQDGSVVGLDWKVAGIGEFDTGWLAAADDILWRNANTGAVSIWFMGQGQMIRHVDPGARGLDWTIASIADLNGDRVSDIVWRHTSGTVGVWLMNSGGQILADVSPGSVASTWRFAGAGDFNGDARADLLWFNIKTRATSVWLMNGGTITSYASPGTVLYGNTVQQVADFNGDRKADILWRDSDGWLRIWFMNGGTIASSATAGSIASEWSVVRAADFN